MTQFVGGREETLFSKPKYDGHFLIQIVSTLTMGALASVLNMFDKHTVKGENNGSK